MVDFQKVISHFAGSVRESSAFSNVTLVAEDDNQIEANQLVLSAASPFFKRILSERKDSHCLIYLEDVSKQQLQNIVNFIYHGEVKIPEEYLKTFMAVSEDLQIKGLLEEFVGEDDEPMADQYLPNISTGKEEEAEKNDKAKAQKATFTEKKSIDSTEKTLTKSSGDKASLARCG